MKLLNHLVESTALKYQRQIRDWRKSQKNSLWRNVVYGWLGSYYEAARRSADRSLIRGWVQDSRFDTTDFDRYELVRIARDLERNDSLTQRLCSLWEQYTVGANGLTFTFASEDTRWAALAQERFSLWAPMSDLSSRLSFACLQSIAARRWFVDGDCFLLKTGEFSGERLNGSAERVFRPRVQLLETHRVCTPPEYNQEEGRTIFGGIEIDSHGRPINYYVKTDFKGETYQKLDAAKVIHICEPDRPFELRPVPVLTPAMLPLHDLRDLGTLEMRAAKKMAAYAAVFKKRNSELSRGDLRGQRLLTTDKTSTGEASTKERIQYVQQVLSDTIALYPDEELEQPKNDRPGLVQQQYWEFLISLACVGVGISKLLVFPHSMQGTVVRADLDATNSFFRSRSKVLQDAFSRVVHYFVEVESNYIPGLRDKPGDWRSLRVKPPRSVTADVGRDSQKRLAELAAGTTTFSDLYAETGDDVFQKLREKAIEARYIRDLAKEYKVDPSDISGSQVDKPERVRTEPKEPTPATTEEFA